MRVIRRHTPDAALGEAGLADPRPTNELRRHWYRTAYPYLFLIE